jgi:peptidoglycan hydrolase-like protein with peptidoglycan-binding domain
VRRKGYLGLGAAAVTAAAAGGTWVAASPGGSGSVTPRTTTATAEVTRGDLVDTKSVDGRLTYSAEHKLAARTAGTLTAMPAPGRMIRQGDVLYQLDRRPVVLLYGRLPLYRPLQQGTKGPDVRQLERALHALGYDRDTGMTVDTEFTAATARAVKAWQKDEGLAKTGSVDATQAVFLPGAVRVAGTSAAVGDTVPIGRPVLTVTSTAQLVHVDLKATDQKLAVEGAKVSVELPDGASVTGRISSVGTVAKAPAQKDGGASEPTVDVEIELTGAKRTGRLDQAPVTVTLESARRKNVLTVPVEALLARREGGFGVEVVEPGGATRVVAVHTGAYGSGRVEISGPGIAPGVRVGVPDE